MSDSRDPINSEAVPAKEAIVAFAAWLLHAKTTRLADIVRELEMMLSAAFIRGRESRDRRRPIQESNDGLDDIARRADD